MKKVEKVLNDAYGVGVAVAPPAAVLWAAESCDDPKLALRDANCIRARHGAPVVHAPWGSPAF